MYKLVYEKRYGSISRNPWSQEELLKNGVRSFGDNKQALWIKSGDYAYGFINDFDKIENYLMNNPAYDANEFLKTNCDRKENINEIIDYWK